MTDLDTKRRLDPVCRFSKIHCRYRQTDRTNTELVRLYTLYPRRGLIITTLLEDAFETILIEICPSPTLSFSLGRISDKRSRRIIA